MSWLSSILKVAAPVAGVAVGASNPLLGGLIGAAGGVADVIGAEQAKQDAKKKAAEAKAANEARYRQALGLYSDARTRALDLNSQVSKQDIADINANFDALSSSTAASLAARGMGNTTIVPTVMQGITRDRTAALNAANDARLQRTNRIDQDYTGSLAQVVGSRVDNGPSSADLATLGAAAGQAQSALGGELKKVMEEMLKRQKPESPETNSWLGKLLPSVFGNLQTGVARTGAR